MNNIISFGGHTPRVHPTAFIAPTAVLIGDVEIGAHASVWFGAVLRGDDPTYGIRVGERTSIQDNCVLHVSARGPTIVEEDVTVGHGAVFESCTIRARSLIGMNAVILHGAIIGRGALVAAGAVVPENMDVLAHTLVAGVPARMRKKLEGESARWILESAEHYVELAERYIAERDAASDAGSGAGPDATLDAGSHT